MGQVTETAQIVTGTSKYPFGELAALDAIQRAIKSGRERPERHYCHRCGKMTWHSTAMHRRLKMEGIPVDAPPESVSSAFKMRLSRARKAEAKAHPPPKEEES